MGGQGELTELAGDCMARFSDIDLLVVTRGTVPEEVQEELVNETYPFFLECGRQLSPQFRDAATV